MQDGAGNLKTDNVNETAGTPGDPQPGVVFDKRFEILALVGTGATGTVYKAKDPTLDRLVALKIMHSQLVSDDEAVQRFKRECIASMQLSHPNIARVYNHGKTEDDKLYLVMDYLEGESLESLLQRTKKLELAVFFEIFAQLINALSYAHSQGIVHRDFKPGNIFISTHEGKNKAYILDFGLAKWIDQGSDQGATKTGVVLGSTAYMSPEQCKGEKEIDQRSDIYSFGCVMLESLTGDCPFKDETAFGSMYKHLNESLRNLQFVRTLPELLAKMIQRCLQKDKSNRYQSMRELNEDFKKCFEKLDTLQFQLNKSQLKRKSNLALILLLACAIPASVLLWNMREQQHDNVLLEQKKVDSKKDIELRAPEQAKLQLNTEKMGDLYREYAKSSWGAKGAITVLENWCKKYKGVANENQFADIWTALASLYTQIGNIERCEYYGNKVLANSSVAPSHAGQIAIDRSKYYLLCGDIDKSMEIIDEAFKKYKEAIETNTGTYSGLQTVKADCYLSKGEIRKAIQILEETDSRVVEVVGPRLTENDMRSKLLLLLERTGQRQKIQHYLDQNDEAAKAVPDGRDKAVADSYYQAANLLLSCDDYDRALRYFELARQAYKKAKLPDDETQYLLIFSRIYKGKGNLAKAEELEKQAMLKMTNPWDNVILFEQLAVDATNRNNKENANRYASDEIGLAEKLFAQNTPMSAKGMLAFNYAINRICIKLADDGKPDEAGRLRDKWIKNFNKKYGVNPFSMDQLLAQTNGLANAGMPDKAIRLADEALKVLSNPEAEKSIMAWGRNPSDWKVDFYMIQSDSYKFMSKPKESIAPAQKALEELKRSNADANSNRFLWALLRTGGGYMLNNQMAEAEKYYSEAQQLWRRVSPGYSAESSCILKAVVDFYLTSKQYREAQKLLTECLHGMSNHYRTHLHPSMQEYYNTLGELFYTEKKYKEATLPFKQSVLISKNEHKNDLYYRHALNRLRECYSLLGQNSEAEAYALEYQKASSIAKEKEQHAKPLGKPDKATEPPAAGQKN